VAQKHQDSEGELQPSPLPEDIARESEAPSEGDSQHGQSDDGSDAPGSQNVPVASWPLRRGLRLEDGIVHRRIVTWPERPRRVPAEALLRRLRHDYVLIERQAREENAARLGQEASGSLWAKVVGISNPEARLKKLEGRTPP